MEKMDFVLPRNVQDLADKMKEFAALAPKLKIDLGLEAEQSPRKNLRKNCYQEIFGVL